MCTVSPVSSTSSEESLRRTDTGDRHDGLHHRAHRHERHPLLVDDLGALEVPLLLAAEIDEHRVAPDRHDRDVEPVAAPPAGHASVLRSSALEHCGERLVGAFGTHLKGDLVV
jgi:hypothetical protein